MAKARSIKGPGSAALLNRLKAEKTAGMTEMRGISGTAGGEKLEMRVGIRSCRSLKALKVP